MGKALRRFGAFALASAAILNTDAASSYVFWPPSETRIQVLTNNIGNGTGVPVDDNRKKMSAVLGGIGVQNSCGIAMSLSPSLGKYSDVYCFQYSNDDLKLDVVEKEIFDEYKKGRYKELIVYGHSMGGLDITNGINELQNEGVNVSTVFLDCSPSDAESVKSPGETMVKISPYFKNRAFGVITKLAVQTYTWLYGTEKRPQNTLKHQFSDAVRVTMDDTSPRTWLNQAASLNSNGIEAINRPIRNVKAVYFLPDDIEKDSVIKDADASRRYGKIYPNYEVVPILTQKHASPTVYSYEYNQAILKILAKNKETPAVGQVSPSVQPELLK